MFKNYLKTAFRNLIKNKGFSAINILGLATGLASCLLIILYVTNELSYDHYNTHYKQIYRVDADLKFGGHNFILASTPDPLGAAMKKDLPQVKQYVRLRDHGGILVKNGTQNIQEDHVILADSTLFDVFTLPMIAGDPHTALTQPHSVVLTESTADKYFPKTSPNGVLGKMLTINDTSLYKITGIIKDVPKASHFHYDFFISMYGQLAPYETGQWTSNNFNTYILLNENADPQKLNAELDDYVMKYVSPFFKTLNINQEEFKKQGNYLHYTLMPLGKIHLYSQKSAELEANSDIQYVAIFSFIALFILLIACVNFMNLSTARSTGRAREVGVRKVLGSLRKNLIFQFLSESLLISFISMILALIMAILFLPAFNHLSGQAFTVHDLLTPWLLPAFLLLVIFVGILAGIYPAFYLSSFKPVAVLKGKLASGFKSGWLRSSLVVFQFAISIFLIIGTIVIYTQLNYIRNKDIGYNRSQVLIIKNTGALGKDARIFRDEALKLNNVEDATMTGYLPTSNWRSDSPLFPEPTLDVKNAISTQMWEVDENYIPTLGMKLMQGRNFSKDFATDSLSIIINEAFAKMLGGSNILDKPLYLMKDFPSSNYTKYKIIGVVKNFNYNSLHDQVTPLALFFSQQYGSIAIRMNTTHTDQVIQSLEKLYKSIAPSQPFAYSFMDADYNNTYLSEQKLGGLSITFSILAIFIASLGLFGLITYAAEQRTKEIGVRKVLGASVTNITVMLSQDLLKLVLIASLISFPIAWWVMNFWLQGFAYRVDISWWIFLVAGCAAFLIALSTICFKAIRAALANPVHSLRSE
ncbi:MAG: ABC transporter permease [Bacteroidetes bacterium]|nr:ABC transporter permease [Bacteroidota bacterium]